MIINKQDIFNETIPEFDTIVEYPEYSHVKNKREHYKLLSYLSKLFNETHILDFGTSYGASALALSQNPTNIVHSYDIDIKEKKFTKENIRFLNRDALFSNLIKHAKIILLDIDPHYGEMERIMYAKLIIEGFRGILVCDDIIINDEMRGFWRLIKLDKHNFTDVGHVTGTGLVDFGLGFDVKEL